MNHPNDSNQRRAMAVLLSWITSVPYFLSSLILTMLFEGMSSTQRIMGLSKEREVGISKSYTVVICPYVVVLATMK